jgi:hypothetical protein
MLASECFLSEVRDEFGVWRVTMEHLPTECTVVVGDKDRKEAQDTARRTLKLFVERTLEKEGELSNKELDEILADGRKENPGLRKTPECTTKQ